MSIDQRDYISLTDMAKARTDAGRAADVIKNWLRTRSTAEFLGAGKSCCNPDFKVVEFDHFKSDSRAAYVHFEHQNPPSPPNRIFEISLPSLN
ncbi:MAG: KilA-N domain-containing protein [Christensenellales bacterium]